MAHLIIQCGNDTLYADSYAHAYEKALPALYHGASVAIYDAKRSSNFRATKVMSMDPRGRIIVTDYTKGLYPVYYIYHPRSGKLVRRD